MGGMVGLGENNKEGIYIKKPGMSRCVQTFNWYFIFLNIFYFLFSRKPDIPPLIEVN